MTLGPLKTDYTGALNTALDSAFNAGKSFVSANTGWTEVPPVYPATDPTYIPKYLTSECISAAVKGQKSFIVFIETSYSPEALRLKGDLLNAYLNGIKTQLENVELINSSTKIPIEVTVSLDTAVVGVNKIKFSFTFA